MNKILTDTNIKAFFALIVLLALVIGFFMKLVAPEVFMTVAATVVTHYFGQAQATKLQKQIDNKDEQIAALSVGKPQIAALNAERIVITE